jgi:hypothetical protein
MKTGKIVMLIGIFGLAVIAGGLVWLAQAPIMPPVQKMEQAIPDDHIPH